MTDQLSSSLRQLELDRASQVEEFETCLALLSSSEQAGAQDVVDELISLSAIYDTDTDQPPLSIYHSPAQLAQGRTQQFSTGDTLLLVLHTQLPHPQDHIQLGLILSLPPTYPSQSAPLLQLENRFLGAEPVPASLWGTILRTYSHEPALPPSAEEGIEWVPGSCCLYEGIEKVKEICGRWIGEREKEREAAERRRVELATSSAVYAIPDEREPTREEAERIPRQPTGKKAVACPVITSSEALVDRKSVFVGHAARIHSLEEVEAVKAALLANAKVARASLVMPRAGPCLRPESESY